LEHSEPLEPLQSARILIKEVLEKVMQTTNDVNLQKQYEQFNALTLYGTFEEPLFIPSEIARILNINSRPWLTYTNGIEILDCTVVKEDGPTPMLLLTEWGLTRLFMNSRSNFAETFRMFIYLILQGLKQHGKVEMNKVLRRLEVELQKEKDRTDALSTTLANQSILKYRVNQYYKDVASSSLDIMDPDIIYMKYLEEAKTTEVKIYLASPAFVQKYAGKKKADDESDDQQIEFVDISDIQYSLMEYDSKYLEDYQEDCLIYFIPRFKGGKAPSLKYYRPVGAINFVDEHHFKLFIGALKNNDKAVLKKKNHFMTSFAEMASLRGECLASAWQHIQAKKTAF